MDALVDGGVMKRIDLAINDHTGILDIPELAEKCRKREYIGKSRSYKFYQSGELIKHREDDREYMGRTLYLGSLNHDCSAQPATVCGCRRCLPKRRKAVL